MKIDITPEEAEYLLDAVDIWTPSKESLRKRLMKVENIQRMNIPLVENKNPPIKRKDLQSAINKTISDPRVNELISQGHSGSHAFHAVMTNNLGVKWDSPHNPLKNKEEEE